jgi:chemotaxis protein MotB
MASGGGGAWKVAYADFVTAMMAFFMVMWLISQKPEVKKAVAEHFRNPGGKRMTGSEAPSILPTSATGNGSRRVVKARGTKKSDGEVTKRKMNDEGKRSNIGVVIPFKLNSIEMTEDGRGALLQLLPELDGKQHRLEVRGHSASSGGNTTQATLDAWNISHKRSMAVMMFLMEQGIDPRRIVTSQAGNSEPRITADELDPSGDSRVEVFVTNEVFEEPSSKIERLVSTKSLESQAIELEKRDKATAAAAAAAAPKGGH